VELAQARKRRRYLLVRLCRVGKIYERIAADFNRFAVKYREENPKDGTAMRKVKRGEGNR
jgi:hypothetical protein